MLTGRSLERLLSTAGGGYSSVGSEIGHRIFLWGSFAELIEAAGKAECIVEDTLLSPSPLGRPGGPTAMTPKEVFEFAKKNGARQIDVRFTDLPGLSQHISYPISQFTEELRGGLRHRRLEHPRLGGDQRERHAADSGPDDRIHGSVFRDADALHGRRHHRPDHAPALRPRPALDREEGRTVPAEQRARRHRLLRCRGRVLHLRQHPVRPEPALRASTSSTRRKAAGTPAARRTTSATGRATRKATSRFRRPTTIRICAPRWWR